MATKIVHCGGEADECPGNWEALEPTGDRMIRYCSGCMRAVYCCESEAEVALRREAGLCAALVEGASTT